MANRLNQDGVPTPRARSHKGRRGTWSPNALRGVLANPVYRGQLVWNRSQWIKDHGADNEKPKRRRYDRPKSEWVRVERPELRIVDDDTWEAAQAELKHRATAYVRTTDGRYLATHTARTAKRKHLLAGFLECAECGGAFYALSRPERHGCAWHRGRGPAACSSTLVVPREALENCVVQALSPYHPNLNSVPR